MAARLFNRSSEGGPRQPGTTWRYSDRLMYGGYGRDLWRGSVMSHFRGPVPRLTAGVNALSAVLLLVSSRGRPAGMLAALAGAARGTVCLSTKAGVTYEENDTAVAAREAATRRNQRPPSRSPRRAGPFMRDDENAVSGGLLMEAAGHCLCGEDPGEAGRPTIPGLLFQLDGYAERGGRSNVMMEAGFTRSARAGANAGTTEWWRKRIPIHSRRTCRISSARKPR
jgi:hypothetical protein